jgi:hypothetical protein
MGINQEDRELLRRKVLDYLAPRFRAAFTPEQIASHLRDRRLVDFPVTGADVSLALVVLRDSGFVMEVRESMGVIVYYQVTGAGILEFERFNNGRDGSVA